MIDSFRDEYSFLSNMYSCKVTYKNITYDSTEAAFHAQKCPERAAEFIGLNPSASKKLGRQVELRSDWEDVKVQIMEEIVREKFLQNLDLQAKLIATGDEELVEGNWWYDTFWGVCTNRKYDHVGENHLGKILMKVRGELSERFR